MSKPTRRCFLRQTAGAAVALSWPTTLGAQSVAAGPVLAVDLLESSPSDAELLLFTCLQGIANRAAPRVYLHLQRSDARWLQWYRDHYGVDLRELADPFDLFAALGLHTVDVVVVDPAAPHTDNLGATYAAVRDWLPVTAELLRHPKLPAPTVREDLRERFRGQDPVAVYEWMLEQQFAGTSRQALGSLDVRGEDVRPIVRYHHARDIMVAQRAACIGLSSHAEQHPREHALKARFLAAMDPFFQVFGWHMERDGERDHVKQVGEHGGLTLCSTESSNFSFHRHIAARAPFRQPQRPAPAQVTLDPAKVYTCFVYSDGDSLNHFSRGHGYSYFHPRRGEVAMSWEVQPLLAELAPGLLEYFYAHATPADTFVASASAIGYEYPELLPPELLRSLLQRTRSYLERIDATTLQVLSFPAGPRTQIDPALRRIYAEELAPQLRAVFEGYWTTAGEPSLTGSLAWLVTRLPVLRKTSIPQQIINELRKAADGPQRPVFLPVHLPKGHMNYADVLDIAAAVDERVRIVSADELAEAWRQAVGAGLVAGP